MSYKTISFLKISYGNILEWYDFSLYIYFATLISTNFFPTENHQLSLLLTFAVFFIGTVIRPLGALIMGYLADIFSYAYVVNACTVAMGISTVLIGLIPNYSSIGILSPILLIILRVIQGLSVGGQFPTLITLGVSSSKENAGLSVGIIFAISSAGFLLASIMGTLSEVIFTNHNQLIWRIPFISSGLLFATYIYINRNENYTEQPSKQKQQTKLVVALFKQYKQIVVVSLITCMCASLYYMVFTYLVNYQIEYQHISESRALFLNSIVLFFACIFYPVFGYIADKYGYIKVFYLALITLVLLFYPLIMLIAVNNFIISFLAILIFCIIMAAIQGAVSPFFALVFDNEWRATGCAISYSIGNGISGAAPLLAGIFTAKYGISGLALYTLVLVVAGTLGSLGIYRTMKNSI
ncbi:MULTISPECIES: MFS transporter [unclassified Francisella]|uniref:MFS transporter n=1 Tax=unclassified Francisella TaxID=2610885 RepID=UPI002E2F297D|nr:MULTISPECIES: MFS transporter [unclassified Francisella]MED7818854.1 MFS transporter [Francisella sp. 19S2-4]MED7829691.1 MFS transporter [Francisella sp. 19S2-10]